MTPKEEAILLYERMFYSSKNIGEFQAKKCALVAIDLAIEIENNIFKGITHTSYWNEVKQEIEKI